MNHDWYDHEVERAVRAKAKAMKCNRAFRDLEEDDLAAELALALCACFPRFDPALSPKGAFIQMALSGKERKLLRQYTGQAATAWRRCRSLDAAVAYDEDGREITLGDQLADTSPASRSDDWAARIDAAEWERQLPAPLREARALLHTCSQTEAARLMGMTLDVFRDRCLFPLRRLCERFLSAAEKIPGNHAQRRAAAGN